MSCLFDISACQKIVFFLSWFWCDAHDSMRCTIMNVNSCKVNLYRNRICVNFICIWLSGRAKVLWWLVFLKSVQDVQKCPICTIQTATNNKWSFDFFYCCDGGKSSSFVVAEFADFFFRSLNFCNQFFSLL